MPHVPNLDNRAQIKNANEESMRDVIAEESECQLHEDRPFNRIESVRVGFSEAEGTIQRRCFLHRWECLEHHVCVAGKVSVIDQFQCEFASDPFSSERRAHVQPLHLAHLLAQFLQCYGSNWNLFRKRQEKESVRRSIVAGKFRKLFVEFLKRKMGPQRIGVFLEERPDVFKILFRNDLNQVDHRESLLI